MTDETFVRTRFARLNALELAMPRKLLTVEDTFSLEQRGTVFAPGLTPAGDERFFIGDPLRLVRPDGTEIVTAIKGIDLKTGPQGQLFVLVPLPKFEVPVGTEVWST